MRGIFPETRKRWTDGLDFGIEDTRSYYEQMYWCFGGDDKAGSDSPDRSNPSEMAQREKDFAASKGYGSGDDERNRFAEDASSGKFSSEKAAESAALDRFVGGGDGDGATQAAPTPGRTFGVDGKSITGSTELDAKIGYTDGVGTGRKGSNFDALNAATAEQLAAAKNTAAQMSDNLDSSAAVKSAVNDVLSNYEVGDITRSGNFTDQGRKKSQQAIQAALTPQTQAIQASDVLTGVSDVTSPAFTGMPNQIGITAPTTGIGPRPAASISTAPTPGVLPSSRSQAVSRALSDVPSSILGRPEFGQNNIFGIGQSLVDNELVTRAAAGDQAALDSLSPAQLEAATDARFRAQVPVGIMSTPQATAANVLGTDNMNLVNDPKFGGPAALPTSRPALQGPPEFIETSRTANPRTFDPSAPNVAVDAVSGVLDFPGTSRDRTVTDALVASGTTMSPSQFAATRGSAPATSTTALGQLSSEEMSALDALAARGFEDETAEMGLRASDLTPDQIADQIAANTGYTDAGLPRGLDFVTTPGGVRATTNLAGPTAAQRAEAPGYLSTIDPVTGEVKEGFIPGAVNMVFGNPIQQAYGFEIPDPTTGEITGVVGPPSMNLPSPLAAGLNFLTDLVSPDPTTLSSSEELLTSTPSVYTGFGPGSEAGFDPDAGGGVPPKAPNDPCPPGFQLINGTCTPVEDGQGQGAAGSNFQINPTTGLPTLFTPFTQATPVGQVNPFALQPYTPGQAATIGASRVAQGIQALSPTGAALGKQI